MTWLIISLYLLAPLIIAIPVIVIYEKVRQALTDGQYRSSKVFRSLIVFFVYVGFLVYIIYLPGADYTERAQVAEAVMETTALMRNLTDHYQKHGTFNGVEMASRSELSGMATIGDISFRVPEEADAKTLVVYTALNDAQHVRETLRGKVITFVTTDGGESWSCAPDSPYNHENAVDIEFLPAICDR